MLKRNAPSRQSTHSGPGRLILPVPLSSSSQSRIPELGDGPTIQTQTVTTSNTKTPATIIMGSQKNSSRKRTTTRTGGGTGRRSALRGGPATILNNGSSSSNRNCLMSVSSRESDARGGDCLKSSGGVGGDGGGSRVPWRASPDVRARNIYYVRKTKNDNCRTRSCDEAVDLLGDVNSTGHGTDQKPSPAGKSVLHQHFIADEFERKVGLRDDNGDAGRSDWGASGESSSSSHRPASTARRRTRTTESRNSSNVRNLKRKENEEQQKERQDRQEERWEPGGSAGKDETSPRGKMDNDEEPTRDTATRNTLTSRDLTAARENSSVPTKNASYLNGHSNGSTESTRLSGVTAADSAKHVLGARSGETVNASARRHPKKRLKSRLALCSISMKTCKPAASTLCAPTSVAALGLSVPAPASPAPALSNKPTATGKSSSTAERSCSKFVIKTKVSDGNLPACPYPGQENVSWTCLGCDGTRHYLTSRNAMEPLQRVHGFKVTRVPNDGDCFYSSIKAALEGSPDLPEHVGAEGLSVAQMRAWVAEEAGEEQLAFYTLQATANAEERWLDFVRPMSDRLPTSDDEDEDEDGDYSVSSQSQESPPRRRKRPAKNRRTAKKCRTRKCNQSEPEAEKENGGGCANKPFPAGNGGRGKAGKTGKAATVAAAADRSTTKVSSIESAAVARVTRGEQDTVDDRDTCRRTRGGASSINDKEVFGWDTSAKTSTKHETSCLDARRPCPSTDRRGGQSLLVASKPEKGNGDGGKRSSSRRVGSRRSYRVGGIVTANEMAAGAAPGTGTLVAKAKKETFGRETGMVVADDAGCEGKKAKEDDGLPFVQSVDELRRFVRLEGSEVGHRRCMWADTFAHHVVSRRLRLTILFVDMEREKSAWPYRVLATGNVEDGDGFGEDERFVVLKREPNHFVLLTAVPPPSPPCPLPGAAGGRSKDAGGDGGKTGVSIGKCGGRGKCIGVVAAPPAKTAALSKKGKSCFRRSELPDVVRKLWNIVPQATLARAVMNEKAGAEARGV